MARNDFTEKTKDTLAKRVGVRCSNPSCRKLTTGPRSESSSIVNIGVASHITAASPTGPRFDQNLTPEERESPENGIWLCQNCGKLVDNDAIRYSVEILNQWKARAELEALSEIEGTSSAPSLDLSAEIAMTYDRLKIESDRHEYRLKILVTNHGNEIIEKYHVDLEFPIRVVDRAKEIQYRVEERCTDRTLFIRVENINHRESIYPGDTKLVTSVNYYIDHELYFRRGDLFSQLVRATLFRLGLKPITVEKEFRELQIF